MDTNSGFKQKNAKAAKAIGAFAISCSNIRVYSCPFVVRFPSYFFAASMNFGSSAAS
jgi:hypothetical protein